MESLQSSSSSSSAISSPNSKPAIDYGERNWLNLPLDTVLSIFQKLNTIDILIRAHNVCTTWRKISKNPFLYRTINMPYLRDSYTSLDLETLCHRAVDYSCGHIIDINIEHFGTDELLLHIADSASHLRRLRLVGCYGVTDEGLCEVAEKIPHLEELDITFSSLSYVPLEAIGQCCPQLKTLKFNIERSRHPQSEYDDDDDDDDDDDVDDDDDDDDDVDDDDDDDDDDDVDDDDVVDNDEAFAIAETMSRLRHLQLFGNNMDRNGLLAILNRCPLLESLDIRRCFNVNLVGYLGKRCQEQIKHLRLPCDATDDIDFLSDDYCANNVVDPLVICMRVREIALNALKNGAQGEDTSLCYRSLVEIVRLTSLVCPPESSEA